MEFDSIRLSAGVQAQDWEEEARRLRERQPGHLLFMCMGNSARSQMAEGIARHLAPDHVQVYSAGSSPSSIKPLALRALEEIGLDTSLHASKGLDAVPLDRIDAVITLCQEEVCPLFPRPVPILHWPLTDPASAQGDEPTRLQVFREVRDELQRRLEVVFSGGFSGVRPPSGA